MSRRPPDWTDYQGWRDLLGFGNGAPTATAPTSTHNAPRVRQVKPRWRVNEDGRVTIVVVEDGDP